MTTNASSDSLCCDEYDQYRQRLASVRPSRRDFIRTTVGALAVAPIAPHMLLNSRIAQQATPTDGPILVVIQLAGGNDGLNTIVPYGSDLYYADRPNIAVPRDKVIPIDATIGWNPNLAGLKGLYDKGKVAVVQGAGYPNPSRSHFQGTQTWETADPSGIATTGWLGRYLDAELAGSPNPMTAVAIGPALPMTLLSLRAPVTTIESVNSYRFLINRVSSTEILQAYGRMYGHSSTGIPKYLGLVKAAGADAREGVSDLQSIGARYTPSVEYPKNPLARDLQLVAQMIVSNLGTRVFHATLGGFDDHAAEVLVHANLLKYLGDSLSAFYADLDTHGKSQGVMSMTFSEFGRRTRENAGRGTDHGTAAPMFLIGGKIKGGMYGDDPILGKLDSDGDLIYGTDFRSVYATVLDGWMNGSSKGVLNGSFERLPFL